MNENDNIICVGNWFIRPKFKELVGDIVSDIGLWNYTNFGIIDGYFNIKNRKYVYFTRGKEIKYIELLNMDKYFESNHYQKTIDYLKNKRIPKPPPNFFMST